MYTSTSIDTDFNYCFLEADSSIDMSGALGPAAPPQPNPTWGTMYIISNAEPNAGLTDGHAWIRLESNSGTVTTMSLWGNRGSQEFWTNLEVGMGYGAYYKSTTITVNNFANINTFNSNSSNINWTPYNTCAGYSANLWNHITGNSLSAVDNLNFTTPRRLSESIINNP